MNFLTLAQEAYESSSAFVDANYRSDWDYSLRAFRNEHAQGSKYLSPEFASRSRIFRPKTRAIIRKNEAAAAVALFSNMEVVDIQPENPDDVMNVAAAAADKALLEYRLSRTIPAFQVCMGGVQDAQTTGAVVSYQYWEYEVRNGRKIKDQPCIELRPIENIRIDGGASWLDPINTSPYLCDIIPMYVCDVRAMMLNKDSKTGKPKWKKYDDAVILRAKPDVMDSTKKARDGKQDPIQENTAIKSFDIVWVMRWFMKDDQGVDHTFYTLGTEELLTDPKPVEEVYFHGKRPYVMGCAILETHRAYKSSMPILIKPLQQETNDIANQRIDNVKFVLNKRWIVARGRQVDVQSLVRNVPGGVTLVTDPKTDVQESNWPDVTSSAYVEQDRINADMDEVAGNFSPGTSYVNKAVKDTLGGAKLATQGAGLMTDYLLRTVIETWWEPVLRQLLLLERHYETDEVVLSICAKNAKLFQRFGVSQINDQLLNQEVNVTVNVGMGSSNPNERFQKLIGGTQAVLATIQNAPPNFNVQEFVKEAYSNMGYKNGTRFWGEGDPRLAKAMQMVQQLQQALQGKQMEMQASQQADAAKIQSTERVKAAELQVDSFRVQGDLRIREAELALEAQRLELEKLKLQLDAAHGQNEAKIAEMEAPFRAAELRASLEQAEMKLEGERTKLIGLAQKIAYETEKAKLDLQNTETEASNEARVSQVSDSVQSLLKEVEQVRDGIGEAMGDMKAQIDSLRGGLGAVAGVLATPKKKPKGISLKKDGAKTKAAVIDYDDGSKEEIAVN